jgi:hypothetical protein
MIKIKSATILALVGMTFTLTPFLRAEDRMRPGLWEITTTLDGKPSGTRAACFTPAMVELANKPAPMLREATEKAVAKNGLCTLKDFKMDGNTISTTQVCGSKSTTITSTYSRDAFDTVVKSTDHEASLVRMQGKFLGACK